MNGGRKVGERLIFSPEPSSSQVHGIITIVIFAAMASVMALTTIIVLIAGFRALLKGAIVEALVAILVTAFWGGLTYGTLCLLWSTRADCLPCELVINRQKQVISSVYRGKVLRQKAFVGADWLMCYFSVGGRRACSYEIIAGTQKGNVTLYHVPPWSDEVVRGVQEKSIAIAEFLSLPLTFVSRGRDDWSLEPGASYNRQMATQEAANRRAAANKEAANREAAQKEERLVKSVEVKIECPGCKTDVLVADVLRGASKYWPTEKVALHCYFSCCGGVHEASIRSGKISMGYLSAAGTAHFCGMEDYEIPGMQVCQCDAGLEVIYEGEQYLITGLDQKPAPTSAPAQKPVLSNTIDAEILDSPPASGGFEEHNFLKSSEASNQTLWVKFFDEECLEWVGAFSQNDWNHYNVVFRVPNENLFLVISSGQGYFIDPNQRKVVATTEWDSIEKIIHNEATGLLVVTDGLCLALFQGTKLVWSSQRVSADGISFTAQSGPTIQGVLNDMTTEGCEFTLNASTHELSAAWIYAEDGSVAINEQR